MSCLDKTMGLTFTQAKVQSRELSLGKRQLKDTIILPYLNELQNIVVILCERKFSDLGDFTLLGLS